MKLQYQEYARGALKQAPQEFWVDQRWRLQYLAFSRPHNAHLPPLLVIGGAFQNFNSYKYSVEHFIEDFPVILVDLPSLGNNDQLAPELKLEQLPQLLYAFTSEMRIGKVIPVGLSLGSVIASGYAALYPQHTEKLIVAGILAESRLAWRRLIEESLEVLEQDRLAPFAEAVVLHLINHARLEETGISATTRRLFKRQLMRANDNEKARYRVNAERLLSVAKMDRFPTCPTLVVTGEHDCFTLPFEHVNYARQCEQASFCLIEGADHLPQFERKEVSMELFSAFLKDQALHGLPGIKVVPPTQYDQLERRAEPRFEPLHPDATLWLKPADADSLQPLQKVRVEDVGFFGCRIDLGSLRQSLLEPGLDLWLSLDNDDFCLPLLPFEERGTRCHCLIRHGDTELALAWKAMLEDCNRFQPIAPPDDLVSLPKANLS